MSRKAGATIIAADHPRSPATFPEFPVLPGAVLLDEALQVIERAWSIDLTHWHIASAKFLDAVRPGDALRWSTQPPESGLIRFTIRAADRTVASGSLRSAAGHGSSA